MILLISSEQLLFIICRVFKIASINGEHVFVSVFLFCSFIDGKRCTAIVIKMDQQLSLSESNIANWFRDQVLFITGSTGFMGKVLVEKLLRDCPDIKTCYLLMRTKRGIEPEQRRDDYINHMVCHKS